MSRRNAIASLRIHGTPEDIIAHAQRLRERVAHLNGKSAKYFEDERARVEAARQVAEAEEQLARAEARLQELERRRGRRF